MKNKKNALWALLLMFLIPTVVGAQVVAFEEWAKNPSGELVEQDFAVAALDKVACERAAEIVDSLWMKETAKRLYRTWGNMTISHDSIKLSCAVRTFGMMPKDGRSLYISMHGGGNCPKEVNDEQWVNQIYLYEPKEGVYIIIGSSYHQLAIFNLLHNYRI